MITNCYWMKIEKFLIFLFFMLNYLKTEEGPSCPLHLQFVSPSRPNDN